MVERRAIQKILALDLNAADATESYEWHPLLELELEAGGGLDRLAAVMRRSEC